MLSRGNTSDVFAIGVDAVLVNARVVEGGAQIGELTLPFGDVAKAEVAQRNLTEVVVGVRPEHLELAAEGASGEVFVVEELGSEAYVHVRVHHDDREELLVVRVGGETTIQRGDNVHVGRPDKVHFFDPGGDRLDEVA